MAVTRWIFDEGGANEYIFPRNPDRNGGDSFWKYEMRGNEVDIVGASIPTIQVDGFRGARRVLRFTAITGDMMRALQRFYLDARLIENCKDHLYGTTSAFHCFMDNFTPNIHPTNGSFPGSAEDTWDLEISLVRMS